MLKRFSSRRPRESASQAARAPDGVTEGSRGQTLTTAWLYRLGWLPLILAGFTAWLLWPVRASEQPQRLAPGPSSEVVVRVAVEPVEMASLALEAEATGTLEPWRSLELSSEVAGRLVERRVEEGQRVDAGELLLTLDRRERHIELVEAEAELLRVQANYVVFIRSSTSDDEEDGLGDGDLAALDAELEHARHLFDQGLIAERELRATERKRQVSQLLSGARRDDVQAATTGLTQAEQRVERTRLALERTRLLAPFSGRIADLTVEEGQQIAAGEPCLVLLDERRMTVDVDVLESDIVRLRVGSTAEVRVPALDERRFAGRVHSINPRVDPDTGTGRVRVVIDNPRGSLLGGLFAYVRLETGRLNDRLLVPSDAVLIRQGRPVVFRVADGRALWTYVETGDRSGERTVIEDGLELGERVIVAGHFALSHEARVQVVPIAELLPRGEG